MVCHVGLLCNTQMTYFTAVSHELLYFLLWRIDSISTMNYVHIILLWTLVFPLCCVATTAMLTSTRCQIHLFRKSVEKKLIFECIWMAHFRLPDWIFLTFFYNRQVFTLLFTCCRRLYFLLNIHHNHIC